MGRVKRLIDEAKDYLWGDGLDFWNTPGHEVHDWPLTNPLHDLVIWNTGGKGNAHLARHHLDKIFSGDYDHYLGSVSSKPITVTGYRPHSKPKNYKSSSSSTSSYQQYGGGGGTTAVAGGPDSYDIPQEGYRKRSGIRGPCESGYVLKKVKGRWMCVRSSTHKK